MAQRDEGVDRLEAFTRVAAEARVALQRDAERVAAVEDALEELVERLDHEMKDLGTTARELDARYGPHYELQVALFMGATMSPFATAQGLALGFMMARSHRQALIASADGLQAAYEHFPEARQEAMAELERAESSAADTFAELLEAATALEDEVQPLGNAAAGHLDGVRAQVAAHLGAGA
jgi:hypothetical protein